ncbi:MAG: hypothetical protein AB1609_20330 [Bacillota bacterium]
MRVTVVVTADGKLSVITRDGTFEQGKARIQALVQRLRAEGVDLPPLSDSDFEQHRHPAESIAVRQGAAGF